MRNPMVSIVVPAYNMEHYISFCIDSLKKQTYQDFEVLLVDDGSMDSTLKICNKFHDLDPRFKVLHKSNGGLSDARNYGMKYATGRYITFIDSDDYVHPQYIEQLVRLMSVKNVDIGCVSSLYVYDDTDYQKLFNKKFDVNNFEVVTSEKAVLRMLKKQGIGHTACGKIYQRNFLDHFQFPVGMLYEDYLTTYNLFARANTVSISLNKLYFYRQRQGSIMHAQKCNENVLSILDISDKVTNQIIKRWPNLHDEAKEQQIATYLKTLQRILNDDPNSNKEYQYRIKNFVKSDGIKLLKSSKVDKKTKIKILLSLTGNKAFIHFYNKFDGSSTN